MAAVTLSHCAGAAAAATVAHRSTEMGGSVGAKMGSFAGLRSVAFAPKLGKSLREAVAASRRGGRAGALVASMVAAPAVRGADVEFQTEVFNKEKITPAGRDEVSSITTSGVGFRILKLAFGPVVKFHSLIFSNFMPGYGSKWGFSSVPPRFHVDEIR